MASTWDHATVEIVNWDKYNPKRSQKTYSWLRLDNNIATDRKLFGLDAEQRYVWIIILCDVSKENTGRYQIDLAYLSHVTLVSQEKIERLLACLEGKGIVRSLHQTPPALHETTPALNETTPTNEHYTRRDGRDARTKNRDPHSNARTTPRCRAALPQLALIWNESTDPALPKVRSMHPGGKRFRACNTRWNENPDPKFWKSLIEKINQNSFFLGKNNRGWCADIEFLCRPDTPDNVIEGKYGEGNGLDPHFWDFLTKKPVQEAVCE